MLSKTKATKCTQIETLRNLANVWGMFKYGDNVISLVSSQVKYFQSLVLSTARDQQLNINPHGEHKTAYLVTYQIGQNKLGRWACLCSVQRFGWAECPFILV